MKKQNFLHVNFSHLKGALGFVWRSSPILSVLNALLVFLQGVLPIVLLLLIKLLVDGIGGFTLGDRVAGDRFYILSLVIFAGLVFLINAIAASVGTLIREKLAFRINEFVHDIIHSHTIKMAYANFENPEFQDIYYRAVSESSFRPSRVFFGFVGAFQNLFTLCLMGGVLVTLHWGMFFLLFIVTAPVVFLRVSHSRKLFQLRQNQTSDERRVSYYNRLLTGKEYAKELRAFQLGDLFRKRYKEQFAALKTKQLGMIVGKTKYEILFQVFTMLAIFSIYGFIALEAMEGNISQGVMVLSFLALQRGYGFLQELLGRMSGLYEDGLYLSNLFNFLEFDFKKEERSGTHFLPDKISKGIVFKDVWFKYPHGSRWVFKNLNLQIQKGETVAVVGANGAGKTTLVKLLAGLFIPDRGMVSIDGNNLLDLNKTSLAKEVSIIFQDFMLYNVSAKENVWFGDVKRPVNSDSLERSAALAGIDTLFTSLKNGYDTLLGNLFEGSEQLSLGEWQRVALARAFYNDAQIVVLDEPTSSMDVFTESRLITHFKEIIKGRTAIIISHRLATINMADRVVFLDEYGVAEEGTHDHLMNINRGYAKMVNSLNESSS